MKLAEVQPYLASSSLCQIIDVALSVFLIIACIAFAVKMNSERKLLDEKIKKLLKDIDEG